MIRRKEKERKQLYDRIFSSEDGQRLLKDLAQRNHVFDVITVPEPSISAFRDGRRSVVVDIINYLNLNLLFWCGNAIRRINPWWNGQWTRGKSSCNQHGESA